MAAVPPAPTLPCKECSFVNEPERVYCHNCGAKLDRSILPREEQIRREPPERARKRIMRMTNPGQNVIKAVIATLVKTLVLAALAAMVILMFRAPADAPPAKPELSSRLVSSELTQLVASPVPKSIVFRQGELNAFLSGGKVKKESEIPGVTYVRTYVVLGPGIARVAVERKFWVLPQHIATIYRAEAGGAPFFAENVGGSIGRLPIHPLIMKYLGPYLFRDLASALKPELETLRKVGYLRIDTENNDPKVVLATRGPAR